VIIFKDMNRQLMQFKQQMKNGRLAQSFLVVGPEKTGKFSTVVKMTGLLNDLSDRELELVEKGEMADIILLQAEEGNDKKKDNGFKKKQSGQEEGRNKKSNSPGVITKKSLDQAIKTIKLKNFQLKKKVLIIRDADKLTDTATNSLLKLIEEPQKDLIIFLLVNNEDDVLGTIKSRCQKINFFLSTSEEVQKMLEEDFDLKKDILEKIMELSGGRIVLAREYAQDTKKVEQAIKRRDDFRRALRLGKIERFKLVDKILADDTDLLWVLNEWIWYLKIFLERGIERGESVAFLKKVCLILEQLTEVRGLIKATNVNKKIQLENFFVQI
jgi:DNA polymerase III delta prime subunit